jgi:gluconate 5-dehydrogenase
MGPRNALSTFGRSGLTGKRLFNTGGSRGPGRDMAVAIAAAGADVRFVARGQPSLEETAGDIRALGRQARAIAADVGRAAECEQSCRSDLERHGPISKGQCSSRTADN